MNAAILSSTSRKDVLEILGYLRSKSCQGARSVHLAMTETFQFLIENPHAGTQRDILDSGIRSYLVMRYRNYLLFSRYKSNNIEIVRVLHGSRNLPRFFR